MRLTLGLLKGALIGGVIAMIGSLIMFMIGAVVAGDSPFYGLSGGLYYSGLLCTYVCPVGLLVGAVIASIRIVRRAASASPAEAPTSRLTYTLALGVPLLVIVGLIIAPYKFANVNTVVTHGATWTIDSTSHNGCATPVILLILYNYAQYEEVCSPKLLSYLQTQGQSVVPVQYRVTSDFGEVRGYSLIRVGDYDISGQEWIGGPGGCGDQYMPPCNSPQAQDAFKRMVTTSSWPETVPTLAARETAAETPTATSDAPPE